MWNLGGETFQIEGEMTLQLGKQTIVRQLIVKQHASPGVLNWALYLAKHHPGLIWTTTYWNPAQQEQLQAQKANYADLAGNLYLEDEGIFILISGKKLLEKPPIRKDRAFFKEGLKVVLMLLADPSLAQKTNRVIAEKTGVSLGTVNNTLKSLSEQLILIEAPLEKNYHLFNYDTLLNEFTDAYPRRLKPNHFAGRYRSISNKTPHYGGHKDLSALLWSGEPGADLITDNLRPEIFILYTRLSRQDLTKEYKLIPDPAGDTWAYSMFWPEYTTLELLYTIQLILIYADLMASDSGRNQEVAKQIRAILKSRIDRK